MVTVRSLDQGPGRTGTGEPPEAVRAVLEGLPVAVALGLCADGKSEPKLTYGNEAFRRLTGRQLSPDTACRLGDLAASRRSGGDARRLHDRFAALQAASETLSLRASPAEEWVCEWRPLPGALDGGVAWSATLSPCEAKGSVAVERLLLRSEQEVARSRALFVEAIESMTDGFVWFDSDGRLVLCNQKYRDLYPKLAGELTAGAAYGDLMKLALERGQFTVLADDEHTIRARLTSDPFPKRPLFRTQTSEGRWIEARNNALECGGFIGLRFDVTSQVTAERAEAEARRRTEAAEKRLTDAIESISGGFALFDADDRLVLCNELYRDRAYEDGSRRLEGATFEEIARANAYGGCIRGLDSDVARETWIAHRVAAHRAAQGAFELEWYDGRSYLMIDRRTHDGGIATVSTDITQLRLARENAEQADRAKTRFLAAASHDLRQPLHAMELFVAALEATATGEEVQAIVGDLREACNAAGRLLNALLDIAELESGKLVPRFADVPVQQLLDRMASVYRPQAQARGLDLRLVRSRQLIRSDPDLLERILGNLLSNAVRYTPQGRILLGCRHRRGKLRIEVWDTGLGIPEAEQHRIFEEFHQVDNAARERGRGVGLGLAIVRRLANILGHKIILHSARGRGSVFAVEIDLTDAPSARPGLRPRTHPDGTMPRRPTVLVIDDDRQIRKGMVRALESWGCSVETAGDYESAAAVVTAAATAGARTGARTGAGAIDLIIADYRLPCAGSGVHAAVRLRALCRRRVPVLIVTADQGPAALQEIAEQGFPALRKPVAPAALRAAIDDQLDGFPDAAQL